MVNERSTVVAARLSVVTSSSSACARPGTGRTAAIQPSTSSHADRRVRVFMRRSPGFLLQLRERCARFVNPREALARLQRALEIALRVLELADAKLRHAEVVSHH